jgi:glycosyltransferase involved in cell wall biosynthesis
MHFLEASHEMRLLINQLDWWERDLVLLAPARMTRRKNLELAIRVVAELKAAGQRPLLVITGPPGPHNPRKDYAEFLREECQRLQLEEEVCFLSQETWFPGRVSHRLVAELYRWADALLFPSLQEGFGLPMLEAGLARLPIFCMDLPVLQVTGEDDVSYFSPETTPAALAEQIRNTLAAPGPAALRRRVLDEYNWETIYRKGLLPLLNKKVTSDDKPTKRAAIA